MAHVKLAPPWITYVSEVEQMFKYDRQVHVVYDNDEMTLKLYVDDGSKADAIAKLMPEEMVFGNVTLKIVIIPSNTTKVPRMGREDVYIDAFRGNPACAFVKTVKGIFTNDLTYVVFAKRVVQYFNDDLGDVYGQCSTLYQNIAKDIFLPQEGVCFCTDAKDPDLIETCSPLGEWP